MLSDRLEAREEFLLASRAAKAARATPAFAVSYVTTRPRSKSSAFMSRRPNRKRKYQRTAQLMTAGGI